MAFDPITQYKAAFKLLFGKAHTSNSRDLGGESKAAFVQLGANQVFGQTIPAVPADAVTAGVAEHVVCKLVLDTESGVLSYQATYPVGHAKAGQNVSNIIPQSYGTGYRAVLLNNGSEIGPLATQNWFLTSSSGIVTSETALSLGTTGTLDCYVYTGQFSQDVLNGIEVLTADFSVSAFDVVLIQGTHATALADAALDLFTYKVGVAAVAISTGATGNVYTKPGAKITFPAGTFTGKTNRDIFVSQTAGGWTDDLTVFDTGDRVFKLGFVLDAQTLQLICEPLLNVE